MTDVSGSRSRALTRRLVVALLSLIVLGGCAAAEARATPDPDFWKRSAESRDTVHAFVYTMSPQAIPSSYDPIREAEQITLEAGQQAGSPANPLRRTLWQQVRSLTVESALSTPLRALGTISLGATAFEVGWKIGSGIRARFLHIGVDASPLTGNYTDPQLDFRSAGSTMALWHSVPLPEDGWVWSTRSSNYSYQRSQEYWSDENPNCPSAGPPPAGFTIVEGEPGAYCTASPFIRRLVAYKPEDALDATGPIEPYTDQPYDRESPAPPSPPQPDVEGSIDDQLANPENQLLRDWLNYRLGSPGAADPLGEGPDHPEIGFPRFVEKWSKHKDEFAAPYDDPYEYWRDAADIVKRASRGDDGFAHCERGDGTLIYWDATRKLIVFVQNGEIQTFYFASDGDGYYLDKCNE